MAVWNNHRGCLLHYHCDLAEWCGVDGSHDSQAKEGREEAGKGDLQEDFSTKTQIDDGGDTDAGRNARGECGFWRLAH